MKILVAGNYTVGSSYSYQLRLFCPRLQQLGHEVIVFDVRNGGGSTAQVGDITILPAALDPIGNDILDAHFAKSRADILLSLIDVWGFNGDVMKRTNWCPLTPIDHTPVPPAVVEALKAAKVVIAISRFGQKELERVGIAAEYWPLTVDPAVWHPGDRQEARSKLFPALDDNFILAFVGVNDSNPSRKGIPELLAAWAMFLRGHPDAKLYLHTTPHGNIPLAGPRNGVDIPQIVKTFGIDEKSIIMPDQYRMRTGIPAAELAAIANAADALILPSRGEGFGLPLIEAQRAGCPVITTDVAGGAELCASKWLIDGEIEWSVQNSTVIRPGIASILENIEKAYQEKDNPIYRRQAVEFGREFEVDYVMQKYAAPLLTRITENLLISIGRAA